VLAAVSAVITNARIHGVGVTVPCSTCPCGERWRTSRIRCSGRYRRWCIAGFSEVAGICTSTNPTMAQLDSLFAACRRRIGGGFHRHTVSAGNGGRVFGDRSGATRPVQLELLLILAALKIFATGISFLSGTPGGMFAPTLFIGAMLGGAVGSVEHHLFPSLTGTVGTYALVGMGVFFAAFCVPQLRRSSW